MIYQFLLALVGLWALFIAVGCVAAFREWQVTRTNAPTA